MKPLADERLNQAQNKMEQRQQTQGCSQWGQIGK
jgi:hypothetical protein